MRIDLGDVNLDIALRIKGRTDPCLTWHWGVPVKATPEDRLIKPSTGRTTITYGKGSRTMDLKADNKITGTPEFTDEMDNVVPAPADFTATYTTDRPDLVAVSSDENGAVTVAAVGALGAANVHGEATFNGKSVTMDETVNVVAGDAERFTVKWGEPEEVTPDEA